MAENRKCTKRRLWSNFWKINHHFTRKDIVSFGPLCKTGNALEFSVNWSFSMAGQESKSSSSNMVLKRRKVIAWALEKVSIFHQDPLYRALVALGLGHKIHINVMATLEVVDSLLWSLVFVSWVRWSNIRQRERSSWGSGWFRCLSSIRNQSRRKMVRVFAFNIEGGRLERLSASKWRVKEVQCYQ